MRINKVETAREIDDLLPMIKKIYDNTPLGKHISISGYIGWLLMNIPRPDFEIWYAINEHSEVCGFVVIEKVTRLFTFECHIHDAYMGWNDPRFSEQILDDIETWAADKQCQTISMYSNRSDALSKRFGFETAGTLLIKAI